MSKLKTGAGLAFVGLGCLLLFSLIGAIPYVVYIGVQHGWLDERIAWAPLGVPGSLVSLLLTRIGFSLLESE